MIKICRWSAVFYALLLPFFLSAQQQTPGKLRKPAFNVERQTDAYLFVYFTGNRKEQEAIRFAISTDGYRYIPLNGNKPVINSAQISATGSVRDPHIISRADGKGYYMVATDMESAKGWDSNRGMVLIQSADLINWTSTAINIQKRFAGSDSLLRVWAPQTIYDYVKNKYMVYWSMKHGVKGADKIYYAYANASFTDLETEPKQLFYSPDSSACIDGDIVFKDGLYYLFFKTESSGAGIKIAVSGKLTEGYLLQDKYVQQTKDPVEGSGVFKLNNSNDYILMYDLYTKGKYQFTRTSDFKNFKVVDEDIIMNFKPRHGTVMPITTAEAEKLVAAWGSTADIPASANHSAIKRINIVADTTAKQVTLPVLPNTNTTAFDPGFIKLPGITVLPAGPQDFSKGPVLYNIAKNGQPTDTWKVSLASNHNPVLAGFYADPDIIYSNKNKRFYIYPTSDGFDGWSGNYFKTFSSADLVSWKDEGVILDLPKDVSWANRNAWAPAMLEKKTSTGYKYYFYFTAAQKIGVAVASDPAGPFTDIGKPLIASLPPGVGGGQQIDPDVFTDPKSGKTFIYWGNGYMACAELNDDLISVNEATIKVITPDNTFREGTTVFNRNGRYYILWSDDDTRSVNYKVRYGISESPTGPITVPANNIVIEKNAAKGIYATGHNSVIQVPGKDEWYIVYHRFNYPKGITMGDAAGFNREVCIDRLLFNADGTIQQTIPTHAGIAPVKAE